MKNPKIIATLALAALVAFVATATLIPAPVKAMGQHRAYGDCIAYSTARTGTTPFTGLVPVGEYNTLVMYVDVRNIAINGGTPTTTPIAVTADYKFDDGPDTTHLAVVATAISVSTPNAITALRRSAYTNLGRVFQATVTLTLASGGGTPAAGFKISYALGEFSRLFLKGIPSEAFAWGPSLVPRNEDLPDEIVDVGRRDRSGL